VIANERRAFDEEFRTVDAVLETGAVTMGVDAFALSFIKHERQLRRLFTFSVYQFPCFDRADVRSLREELAAHGSIGAKGFLRGLNALWPKPVPDLVGTTYSDFAKLLAEAGQLRNKIFHGQISTTGVAQTGLLRLEQGLRSWCLALAEAAQKEVGYDGFRRNSFHKSTDKTLHQKFLFHLNSSAEYRQLIRRIA
jgi:hypothetical protein